MFGQRASGPSNSNSTAMFDVSIVARTEVRALLADHRRHAELFQVSILARTEVRALRFAYNAMTNNVKKRTLREPRKNGF